MPTYKKLAPFVIILVAGAGLFAYAERERITQSPTADVPVVVATTTVKSVVSTGVTAAPVTDTLRAQTISATTTANATFKISDTAYPLEVSPSETVIEAMRVLAASSTFSFTGRDYPGLGFFVDSINEKKNAGGMYWILYVNGIVAPTGVSATVVSAGDIVEWRYEKSY